MKKLLFIALLWLPWHLQAQSEDSKIKITDLLKIKQLNDVSYSKDGKQLMFSVNSIIADKKDEDEYQFSHQLYLFRDSDDAAPRQLTYHEDGASQASWSPDGKQIAFVRKAGDKPQIFLLSLEGGEAMQLTDFQYGANGPQWSPDGKRILFTSGIKLTELLADTVLNPNSEIPAWSYEKPGFFENEQFSKSAGDKADADGSLAEIRRYLDKNEKDNKAKVINQLQFQEEAEVTGNIRLSHVFIVDIDQAGAPRDLTPGFSSARNPVFTPDGNKVIFEANLTEDVHPHRGLETAIYSIEPSGENMVKVLGEEGKSYSSATLSPSGKWLAFQHSPTMEVRIPTLAIMPLNGNKDDIIDVPYDRNKGNFVWSEDEKYLYFTAQSNGGTVLNRLAIKSKAIEQLSDYEYAIGSFDLSGKRLVYTQSSSSNPDELYRATIDFKKNQQLSTFNQEWLADKAISNPERFSFTNDEGQEVEYWVMKPIGFEEGEKYPLLLEIHGGPSAMWGPPQQSMWHEYQYFAARGYGVVYANPRGSGGYGEDFLRGNINNWGEGPANDILTALDKTIALGWADTSKLAITGGSYGGYMVSWILAHDQRFKAACSQRGVYDLTTFFGEGNAWRLVPRYFGGYPWEEEVRPLIQKESPLTYVDQIQTPLIIFHGESDLRTGVIQSEMLYKSLKILDRPVEYVRHPGATHEITRSGNNRQRIDQMLRTYEFFERYLHEEDEQAK